MGGAKDDKGIEIDGKLEGNSIGNRQLRRGGLEFCPKVGHHQPGSLSFLIWVIRQKGFPQPVEAPKTSKQIT